MTVNRQIVAMPIEMAPDDPATPILIWCPKVHRGLPGCEVAVVYRSDGGAMDFWTNGGANAGSDFCFEDDERPTHWRPLPPPPETAHE